MLGSPFVKGGQGDFCVVGFAHSIEYIYNNGGDVGTTRPPASPCGLATRLPREAGASTVADGVADSTPPLFRLRTFTLDIGDYLAYPNS